MKHQISLTTCFLLASLASLSCVAADSNNSPKSASSSGAQSSKVNQNLMIPYPTDVLTYHYNVYRQGSTSQETILTTSNVNSSTFGKIGFYAVDGKVDAQPLFVNKQFISGGLQDTLYVVTENDSVYAFAAASGRQFWKVSVFRSRRDAKRSSRLQPDLAADRHHRNTSHRQSQRTERRWRDVSGGDDARILPATIISVCTPSTCAPEPNSSADQSKSRPHIQEPVKAARTDKSSSTQASSPNAPRCSNTAKPSTSASPRTATARPYTGWIMAYNARTLAQTSVIDVTPNGNEGSIWMAGDGLAADASGNIYFLAGERHLRHNPEPARLSRERRLRQRLREAQYRRRNARRSRLLHDVQHGAGIQLRHRSRLRRSDRAA